MGQVAAASGERRRRGKLIALWDASMLVPSLC